VKNLLLGLVWGSSVVALLASVLLNVFGRPDPYEPLGEYPEQTVTSRVPGIEGPAAYRGETVVIVGTKCVAAPEPVAVAAVSFWRLMGPVGPAVQVPYRSSITVRSPGCVTTEFRNALGPEVTPGLWRLEGWDTVESGDGRRQTVAWNSQTFRVAER